ncbi:unnamed protein product [Prunus brigantina]
MGFPQNLATFRLNWTLSQGINLLPLLCLLIHMDSVIKFFLQMLMQLPNPVWQLSLMQLHVFFILFHMQCIPLMQLDATYSITFFMSTNWIFVNPIAFQVCIICIILFLSSIN